MGNNRQVVLQLLKSELEFLDKGGYRHHPRSPWRAPSSLRPSFMKNKYLAALLISPETA